MIDADFMAGREDTIRPDEVAAVDAATPDSPDAGAPEDTGPQDDGQAAPPPTAGMTSQPDGEELPPIVESDPTLVFEAGLDVAPSVEDLPLPGVGFNYEFALYA